MLCQKTIAWCTSKNNDSKNTNHRDTESQSFFKDLRVFVVEQEMILGESMTKESVQGYWQKFLSTLPQDSPYHSKTYIAEGWGDSSEMADELGGLIAQGIKTGTCSALWEWEAEGNPIPQAGLITIALDGRGEPLCIIETVEVTVCKYNEVDAEFARAEGEGDLSLNYWREAHRNFFSRVLPKIGKEFSEEMPLVCERFKMLFK